MDIKIRKMQADGAMKVAAMNRVPGNSNEKATRAGADFCRDRASFGMKAKVRQIDLLFIDEEYRGLGIAADLLDFVRLDAIKSGCKRLDIQTEASNAAV